MSPNRIFYSSGKICNFANVFFKVRTEVPELQDVVGQNSMAQPSPTARTTTEMIEI